MTKHEIGAVTLETIQRVCAAAPHAQQLLARVIQIEFNSRLTRTIGRAYPMTGKIQLSTSQWARLTPEERREVVIHEVCHIIAYMVFRYEGAHGEPWKKCMRLAGFRNPRTRMAMKAGRRPRRRQKRYSVYCGCMVHKFSGRRIAQMKRGATYFCRQCNGQIYRSRTVQQAASGNILGLTF